jgi:hypothetical protein
MTWPYSTWCVVPCPGSRADELLTLVATCGIPDERLLIVTTETDTFPDERAPAGSATVVLPPVRNIARWWNEGLSWARGWAEQERLTSWEVFLPGSDVTGETWSVAMLAVELRKRGLTMVGPHLDCAAGQCSPRKVPVEEFHAEYPRTLWARVPGACMLVAGESGLRFDERMPWWYSDDDAETWARHHGGAGLVHGTGLLHPQDHMLDAEQAEQATASRALYVEKWGREPW